MNVIGLHSSFNGKSHDPNVALLQQGRLTYAAEEERFLRYKTASGRFPEYALENCLKHANLSIRDVDLVAFDGITSKTLARKIERKIFDHYGYCPKLKAVHHADSHCYGAYYSSGFKDCLIISLDGNGDCVSGRIYKVIDGNFTHIKSFPIASSLGNFYTACTNYLGFKSVEGEYKVMGMAAYGDQESEVFFDSLSFNQKSETIGVGIDLLDSEDISSIYEPAYNSKLLSALAGFPPRGSRGINQAHFDFASRVQRTFEKVYLEIIEFYAKKTNSSSIVLSGGCSLNVLANYKLAQRNKDFNLFVFPAASDRGLAVGNAILGSLAQPSSAPDLSNLSMGLGNQYSNERIFSDLNRSGLPFQLFDDSSFYQQLANLILEGNVVGFFQGRSEYGPRALGFRSIIANARCKGIKDKVNQKIKFREKYRPFAPALLEEDFLSLSEGYKSSPYMTVAFDVSKDSEIFGETMHEDGTARVQTVDSSKSPYFYSLLTAMKDTLQQLPCILNTSFNLAGEPIVESPSDALRTFVSSDLDFLAIGNYIVSKQTIKI